MWSRNDNDVQSSERILIDKNNNDLIINGIQKEDTGQYMCTAVNPLGEARESSYVSIIGKLSLCGVPQGSILWQLIISLDIS